MNKIQKVAFVYLMQGPIKYFVTDDIGYSVQKRPQLGLQYLCAVLEKRGVQTALFDQVVKPFDIDWLLNELRAYQMVGFYCSDPQEDKVKHFSKRIKEELGILVLVGGPVTLINSSFLDHDCDIVVHGEGEITIQQIVEYYEGKRRIEDIKGISYKDNARIIKTPPQELINDLDELPFPDRSKIPIDSYYDYFIFSMRKPYTTMIASRGCMYRCAFCTSCSIWRYKYRTRSVDNVLSEIDYLVAGYNIKYIGFQDDVFGINNNWLEEFCRKLIERPYRIRWMPILHPFSLKTDTERILRLLKRAGADTLSFGLQSAHPEILKNINRNPAEPEHLKKIFRASNKLGLMTAVSYIFGLPGDTKETIHTTIEYSAACGSTLAHYFILSVLKGSEIDERYKDKQICMLTEEEIQGLLKDAPRRFYTRPQNMLRIAYFVARNPAWVFKVGRNLPSILARIGFVKSRKRKVKHENLNCYTCL